MPSRNGLFTPCLLGSVTTRDNLKMSRLKAATQVMFPIHQESCRELLTKLAPFCEYQCEGHRTHCRGIIGPAGRALLEVFRSLMHCFQYIHCISTLWDQTRYCTMYIYGTEKALPGWPSLDDTGEKDIKYSSK